MGLTMKERKAITREVSRRYKKAIKKEKGAFLMNSRLSQAQ